MARVKIDGKIESAEVVREPKGLHERMERPEVLEGSTYRVKTPLSEHALYVTINDIVLDGERRPFELFINSKNMEHFQWIIALTRVVSAVFRKGGDCTFLVEELRSVFDPKAGYFKKGRWTPSLVAEIGDVVEQHLQRIGMVEAPEAKPEIEPGSSCTYCGKPMTKAGVGRPRTYCSAACRQAAYRRRAEEQGTDPEGDPFPAEAVICPKCQNRALVKSEGCLTCLNCGDSKCS